MKELRISGTDKVAIVDDEDFERLSMFGWRLTGATDNIVARTIQTDYRCRHISLANTVVQEYDGLYDHKDRNPLNNSKENLRPCNLSDNAANRAKSRGEYSSKYKGVTFARSRNKWQASIMKDGKSKFLGYHLKEEDAARAYNDRALETFGEFAVLNTIPNE